MPFTVSDLEDLVRILRERPEWRERLREVGRPGPYPVYMYAIRVDPAAIEQAHAEGIGVMSGRGIPVEPRESLPEV